MEFLYSSRLKINFFVETSIKACQTPCFTKIRERYFKPRSLVRVALIKSPKIENSLPASLNPNPALINSHINFIQNLQKKVQGSKGPSQKAPGSPSWIFFS